MSENKYKNEAKDFFNEISGSNDIKEKRYLASLTGFSFIKRAIISPFNIFSNMFTGIKNLFSFVLPNLEIPDEYKLPKNISDPLIRFEEARKQFNTKEEDLINLLNGYRLRVAIYFFMLILTIFIFPTVLSRNEIFIYSYPLQLIFCVSFGFLMVVYTLRSSFYHYQIRNKALFSFNKFIRLPGEWFPESIEQVKKRWKKNEKNNINKKVVLKRQTKKE